MSEEIDVDMVECDFCREKVIVYTVLWDTGTWWNPPEPFNACEKCQKEMDGE